MTAVTTVRTRTAAFLISDSALCDFATGKMVGVVSKQFLFPHIPAVASVRGRMDLFLVMYQVLFSLSATSFSGFKSNVADYLKAALLQAEVNGVLQRGWQDFELHVAGWSDGQPASFFVTGSERYAKFIELFTPVDLGTVVPSPSDDALIDDLIPHLFENGSDAVMRELIARQGAIEGRAMARGEKAYAIGGGVQVTRVSDNGITTRYVSM